MTAPVGVTSIKTTLGIPTLLSSSTRPVIFTVDRRREVASFIASSSESSLVGTGASVFGVSVFGVSVGAGVGAVVVASGTGAGAGAAVVSVGALALLTLPA